MYWEVESGGLLRPFTRALIPSNQPANPSSRPTRSLPLPPTNPHENQPGAPQRGAFSALPTNPHEDQPGAPQRGAFSEPRGSANGAHPWVGIQKTPRPEGAPSRNVNPTNTARHIQRSAPATNDAIHPEMTRPDDEPLDSIYIPQASPCAPDPQRIHCTRIATETSAIWVRVP